MIEEDKISSTLSRAERRDLKRYNRRKMKVSGRSVFLLEELAVKPKKKKKC